MKSRLLLVLNYHVKINLILNSKKNKKNYLFKYS